MNVAIIHGTRNFPLDTAHLTCLPLHADSIFRYKTFNDLVEAVCRFDWARHPRQLGSLANSIAIAQIQPDCDTVAANRQYTGTARTKLQTGRSLQCVVHKQIAGQAPKFEHEDAHADRHRGCFVLGHWVDVPKEPTMKGIKEVPLPIR